MISMGSTGNTHLNTQLLFDYDDRTQDILLDDANDKSDFFHSRLHFLFSCGRNGMCTTYPHDLTGQV